MEKENEFLIPVSGLALGVHNYKFDVKDDFFADLDYSEVKHAEVTVDLEVEREELMMTLNFHIEGKVEVPCDRCADEFFIPIHSDEVFYIKIGAEEVEESDDVVVVPAEEHAYDIRSLVYEYIILSIPIHRVHPEGECNPQVIALLSHEEESSDEREAETDPRWAALKDVKIEDN
ncbi:MAG: DUF177 domain-containing protein [Bacteroidales bacterium]|nr:DUF177 domain-containing protein [Bacteroidales bacterium]